MEKFYKKIKDKMSKTPDVPTDWGMWDDVEASLDRKKHNRFFPIWLGLPFLIFLSGFIGYLMAPKSDISIADDLEIQRDTIYITKAISSVDTVIKTEYITKWKYQPESQHQQLQSKIISLYQVNQSLQNSINSLDSKLNDYRLAFSEIKDKNNPKYAHLDFSYTESNNIISNDSEAFRNQRYQMENIAFSPILTPKMIDYRSPKLILINDLWFQNLIKNKKSESLFEQIVPDYINIGLSAELPGLTFTKNLSPGLEAGLGLNIEFLFSPRFSVVTGIRNRLGQNGTSDELVASNYPQPVINLEESFKNLKVKTTFIDIPLSLKYRILNIGQNDLYLSGGLLVSKDVEREYVYEYIRNASEIYYEVKREGGNWSIGSSIFSVGYEFDAWSNTSAFFESYIRHNFNSDEDAIHGIGFRFGMYYKI